MSASTNNHHKYKDLSLNDSFLRNKHFFTPKSSGEEQNIKTSSKDFKKHKKSEENLKKNEFSPKSTAFQTDNYERKNQFCNPIHFESPGQISPTPTKVEFGNIFTEEEEDLSDNNENLINFEKKFPEAIIEKYSKKSKKKNI